jgi:hypothetical protein
MAIKNQTKMEAFFAIFLPHKKVSLQDTATPLPDAGVRYPRHQHFHHINTINL